MRTLASGTAQFDTPHSWLLLSASLTWRNTKERTVSVRAFVESGAADNFLDTEFARKMCLPFEACPSSWKVQALDGRPIRSGVIKFRVRPLHLTIGGSHHEIISLDLLASNKKPLILG